MTYTSFILDLTGEEQRNLLTIGKKTEDGRGISFDRSDINKAVVLIGNSVLEAFPMFVEYDGVIAVSGDCVSMEYFDVDLDMSREIDLPLEWCLEYLKEKGKLNSFDYDEDEPRLSQVEFTFDINIDVEQTATDYAYDFIPNLDECDARHMLFAYYMEQQYKNYNSQLQDAA